jgi:hypothetical protein
MSVTVSEVLVAARSGLAAVSSETAGYLVLGTADCLGEAPIGIANVYLDEDGALRLDRRAEAATGDGEAGLRTVLKRLLETGRSPAPALLRVASASEKRGVRRLIAEIEAALIPVNRAAARRALARLHRDVLRGKAAGKLSVPPEELLSPEPSAAPPKAAPAPAVLVEKPSTEGPTPVVPGVEPIPVIVSQPVQDFAPVESELAPVEVLEPSPAPWVEYVPEATPFLGSLVTAPRDFVALGPAAEAEVDAADTDRAPPVSLVEPSDTPRFAAQTAVLGSYGASSVAPPVSLEIPIEVAFTEESPEDVVDEAPLELASSEPEELLDEAPSAGDPEYEVSAAPECVPFEPVFAREASVVESAKVADEEREARDALERALLDFDDGYDVAVSVEAVDPPGEGFVPMFELLPESVPGEQAPVLECAPVAEEDAAAVEALIDEALAVVPEVIHERPPPDSAPSLPHVSAVVYESGTMPGLGFVNVALVAANVQDTASPVPPLTESVSAEPELALAEPELALAEPELALAERPEREPAIAEPAVVEPPVAEFTAIEPAIAEFEAMAASIEFDVFEPAIAEPAPEPEVPAPVVAAAEQPALVWDDLADEYAGDEYSSVEYAPVEYAVKVVAAPELDAVEPADEAVFEASDCPGALPEPAVVVAEPVVDESAPEVAREEPEPLLDECEPAVVASAVVNSFFESEIVEPEDESVVIPAAEAPSYRPRRSEVADLVAAFVVAEARSLAELSRELKRIAGIGATPPPPEVAPAPAPRKVSSAR